VINSRYALPQCRQEETLSGVSSVETETENAIATNYGSAFGLSWGPATYQGTARSGYNSSAKITFHMDNRDGAWCGNALDPTRSGQVPARLK
jgi:hypothetical protein